MDIASKILRNLDPIKKASTNTRYSKNVPGKWFVDDSCIDCDYCKNIAFNNFKRDAEDGQYYVCKQPTESEIVKCLEAKKKCPVNAIHGSK
jgi:ferredoxin